MPEVTLHAEAGRTTGSRASRRLRTAGKIPGVVYGHGAEPLPVAIGAREFQVALSGEAGLNTLLSLQVDGKDYLTLARAIQRHPSRNVVTHVDFQIVRRDEVISAEVSINLVGEAIEVAHGDGVVEQQLFTLVLRAKPADIPPSLELDISELTIGSSLHVSDLVLPAGVELETDPETSVVTGQPPRVQAEEVPEGEGVEGEEGAEGAEGAGAAAAAGEGAADSGGAAAEGAESTEG